MMFTEMGSAMKIARGAVSQRIPQRWLAEFDRRRPWMATPWGGPLNGQKGRRSIVRALARSVTFDDVVETGTYRGTSTEFFYAVFGTPVVTVEANERNYYFSRDRLAPYNDISVRLGDSRWLLRTIAHEITDTTTTFMYLDAHWEEDLPLNEELSIIAQNWRRVVVMVDDFEVVDDEGYRFDDYGDGKRLSPSYVPESDLKGWSLYYPAVHSSEETGAVRGCCVLVSEELDAAIRDLPELRKLKTYK